MAGEELHLRQSLVTDKGSLTQHGQVCRETRTVHQEKGNSSPECGCLASTPSPPPSPSLRPGGVTRGELTRAGGHLVHTLINNS